jgi:hypothetical protein
MKHLITFLAGSAKYYSSEEFDMIKMQRDAAMQEANDLYWELQETRHQFQNYKKEMEKKLKARYSKKKYRD